MSGVSNKGLKDLASLQGSRIESTTQPGVSYHLQEPVGRGAMGVAFYARRHSPAGVSPVVLKITRPDFLVSTGDAAALMIQKEAVSLGRLNEHVPPTPYVVRLVDSGVVSLGRTGAPLEVPWNAVEYIHGGAEGTTLHSRIRNAVKRTGFAFDLRRAGHCFYCITQGLRAIHEVGVIHRDLSTNNVLCCGTDETEIFKIVDFGIARPVGVKETFGDVSLGTPGYAAPEQLLSDLGPTGTWGDVFSVAAILFCVLTGENYFKARSPVEALIEVRDDVRRRLADVSTLGPELRSRPHAREALDRAFARATASEPSERPQTVEAFVGEVAPWLAPGPDAPSSHTSVGLAPPTRQSSVADWEWTIRHHPGDERVVRSVAWDGDGRCLVVTTSGLLFWDGMRWADATPRDLDRDSLRFVSRIGAGQWIVGGGRSLSVFSEDGVRALSVCPPGLDFEMSSGDPADLAVVVASEAGERPRLHTVAGKRWFRPLDPLDLGVVAALSPMGESTWLIAGRSASGQGRVVAFNPLEWSLAAIETPPTRAFMATAGQALRRVGVAAGAGGLVVRSIEGAITVDSIDGAPDLSSTAVDETGRAWAGSSGSLYLRDSDEGAIWERAWHDAAWTAPFVSLFAQEGQILAMTADGAVLEGRAAAMANG